MADIKNGDFENKYGDITLELTGAEKDYNFDLMMKYGDINLNGRNTSEKDLRENNGGGQKYRYDSKRRIDADPDKIVGENDTPKSLRRAGGGRGQTNKRVLVSSVAGSKAERQEKRVVKSGLQARFQVHMEEKSFRSSP